LDRVEHASDDHNYHRAPRGDRNDGDWEFNPLYRTSRGAEALGYARRSPPARATPDYLFKDHNFGLHSAGSGRLVRRRR